MYHLDLDFGAEEKIKMEILMLNHHFLSQKNFCTILVDGEPPLIHILICDLVVVASVPNDLKDPHDEPLDGFHGEAEVWRRAGGVRLKQLGERIFHQRSSRAPQ